MIFQHAWEKVLSGEKTQTRRIVKPGEGYTFALSVGVVGSYAGHVVSTVPIPAHIIPNQHTKPIYSVVTSTRTVYAVDKTYAVQPGRTKSAIARIQITGLRREDVREISEADARAEGFENQVAFWRLWYQMHDSKGDSKIPDKYWEYRKSEIPGILKYRRRECYQAWVLTFALAQPDAGDVGE